MTSGSSTVASELSVAAIVRLSDVMIEVVSDHRFAGQLFGQIEASSMSLTNMTTPFGRS